MPEAKSLLPSMEDVLGKSTPEELGVDSLPSMNDVLGEESPKKKDESAPAASSMFGLKNAPLGSEAPSTSNTITPPKTLNFSKAKTLQAQMQKDFSANPSKNYQLKYIDALVKRGYDKESLMDFYYSQNPMTQEQLAAQPEYTQSDADKLLLKVGYGGKNDIVKPIVDWGVSYTESLPAKIGSGLENLKSGIDEALLGQSPSESLHGVLKGVTGATEVAFQVIPEAAAFNASMDAVNTAARKNLSEDHAKAIEDLTSTPFTIASRVGSAMGYKPDEGSSGQMLMQLADFAILGAAFHAKEAVPEKIQSIQDLKDISKKVAEKKLSPDIVSNYNDALSKVTIEDIKNVAEKADTPEGKEVVKKIDEIQNPPIDEKANSLEQLQNKIDSPEFSSLPPAAQEAIKNDVTSLSDEMSKDAHTSAELHDIDINIGEIKNQIEGAEPAVKESLQKSIDELNKKREELINQKSKPNGKEEEKGQKGLLEQQPTTEQPAGEQPAANAGAETSATGISYKTDAEIENRMSEIQNLNPKFDSPEQREFDTLEKEMQRRERQSVFGVPIDKASEAIDLLMKKDKEMPNGFGSFLTKRDASEAKHVVEKYVEPNKISDEELKRDFKNALLGNPDTWYTDGLKLRESMNEASRRGIKISELIKEIEDEYVSQGYSISDARETVKRKFHSIFNSNIETNATEKGKIETNIPAQPEEANRGGVSEEAGAGNQLQPTGEKVKTPEEVIDYSKGKEEVSSIKEGFFVTKNPLKIFKGLFGKVDEMGNKKTAHPNVKGVFGSVDENIAKRYEGDFGRKTFSLPAGISMEVVEIKDKSMPVSKYRQAEEFAINKSNAQVVKLITIDSRGELEEQYIIKDKSLLRPKKAIEAIKEIESNVDENKLVPESNKEKVSASVRKLGNAYIEEGVKSSDELIKHIKDDLKDVVDKSLLDEDLEGLLGKQRGFSESVMSSDEYKNRSAEIMLSPEHRYTPQKLAEGKALSDVDKVEQANDLDEINKLADKEGGNFAVLSAIGIMNRAASEGNEKLYNEAFDSLDKSGTTLGQLLRQYAEFSRSTKEGVVRLVEKKLDNLNRKLTDESKKKLSELADNQLKANREYNEFLKVAKSDISPENSAKLHELEKAKDKSNQELFTAINSVVPKGWDVLLGTVLKGNLLTGLSVARNITYNVLKGAFDISAKLPAIAFDYVHSALSGKPREIYFEPGYVKEVLKGYKEGTIKGLKQIKTGTGAEKMTRAEYASGLQPFTAIKSLRNSDMMSVDKDGNITLNDKAKKIYEGVFGANAELMFRLLNLGDKPKSSGVYRGALYEIGRKKGLKGDALKKFIEFPDESSAKDAMDRALFSTFQNEGWTAKTAQSAISAIKNRAKGTPISFILDSVAPFVKTPLNILSQTLDYTIPPVSVAKAIMYAKKGDTRMSKMMMGRFVTATILQYFAQDLFDKNIIIGGKEPKGKEKESGLIETTGGVPANSFNISAFERYRNGDDPSRRYEDKYIPLLSLGMAGAVLNIHANRLEKEAVKEAKGEKMIIEEGKVAKKEEGSSVLKYILSWANLGGETTQALLEQSFLKGTNELINAASKGEWDRWLASMVNTTTNAIMPNNMATISRVSREFKPKIKDDELGTWIENTIKSKTFNYFGAGKDMLPNRGIFGEKIKETPEGNDPIVYNFFDVIRISHPNSKLYQDIQNLYNNTLNSSLANRAASAFPDYPRDIIKIGKQDVKLSPEQYDKYLEMVGQERLKEINKSTDGRASISNIISSPSYSDEIKLKRLDDAYELGKMVAEKKFIKEIMK